MPLLGLGLGLHLLVRPYESVFLVLTAILFVVPKVRGLAKPTAVALAVMLPALGLTFLQNKQVTGRWTTLPYMLSRDQYGVPAAFTFQADPVPHRELTQQQHSSTIAAIVPQQAQRLSSHSCSGWNTASVSTVFSFSRRCMSLCSSFCRLCASPRLWVVFTLAIFALGVNFYPFFEVHYLAALTCLFVLVSITGLQHIEPLELTLAAQIVLFLCVAHFVFWYGLHLFEGSEVASAMEQYETWDGINHGNPQRRIVVNRQLAGITGKLLVFVRYWPQHHFQEEWVYNEADIDQARIVWARDLGDTENEELLRYYPGRVAWLLEPDAALPKLSRYMASPAEPAPASKTAPPPLRFEQVK